MIMKIINIPFSFLKKHNIILSAKEINFALSRKLIDINDLGQIVDVSLIEYPNDEYLLKIAFNILLNGSYLNPYVQYLEIDSNSENREDGTITIDDDFVNERWKYIILLWLFNNRRNNDTDYERIDSVYADFGYPSDMASFVSYMPIQKESEKDGYEIILNNWKKYLSTNRDLLNP